MDNFIPINDGYTEPGYIAPLDGVHGELRFTFRPLLHGEREAFKRATAAGGDVVTKAVIGMLATKRHLVSWECVDSKGSPVAITAENVGRLRPSLLDRLFNVVAGWVPSDADPQSAPQAGPSADAELDALLKGESTVGAKEAASEKN